MENYWHAITDVDPGNNRIEIGFNAAQFTAAYSEQGGNLLKIANLEGTKQRSDGYPTLDGSESCW